MAAADVRAGRRRRAAGAAVGARLPRVDGVRQGDRPRALRRRRRAGRCAVDPRRALAACPRALHPRRSRRRSRRRPGRRADRGRRAVQRLRHLSRHQGPAGAGRRPGALSRRGGRGAGRRARHGARDPRRGGADRLDARAAAVRASMPRPRPTRRWCRPTSPTTCCCDGGVAARQGRRGVRRLRRRGRGRVRDRPSSSTPISSPRPAGPARRRSHRDPRLDPDALHGPRRGRDRHAASARGACASCRPPAAAASAASSISRSSR